MCMPEYTHMQYIWILNAYSYMNACIYHPYLLSPSIQELPRQESESEGRYPVLVLFQPPSHLLPKEAKAKWQQNQYWLRLRFS